MTATGLTHGDAAMCNGFKRGNDGLWYVICSFKLRVGLAHRLVLGDVAK